MKNRLIAIASAVVLAATCCGPKDGEYTIRLLTTNDVHGRYFDTSYQTGETTPSLMSLAWYIGQRQGSRRDGECGPYWRLPS